jgi:N-acetylglutamate synthase-like GNAT family acetyltransferase
MWKRVWLIMTSCRVANFADLQRLKIFLEEQGLTVEGVDDWIRNFLIMEDQSGNWIGVAGYELYGESCLLRSVGVGREFRRKGFGKQIVDQVLRNARSKGALSSYLLTGNAVGFFSKMGFETIKRDEVESVSASKEFRMSECECAIVMRKIMR